MYEFKPMLDEKELDCKLSVPKDLEWKCDIGKMQRVFDNLLRNAVNYSFEKDTIFLSVTEEVAGIKIVCVNHGNTIPKEKLERIFEQFIGWIRHVRQGAAAQDWGLQLQKKLSSCIMEQFLLSVKMRRYGLRSFCQKHNKFLRILQKKSRILFRKNGKMTSLFLIG